MKLTNKQIENLWHSGMKSFLSQQFERFEIHENKNGTNYSLS